jgi:DNA-binding transcriptional LysR family regulator
MNSKYDEPTDASLVRWNRRIRLRHLEVLLVISRHRSLTAAAAELDITQPAVSQWLADIEAAVGVRLFERSQGLRPTPYTATMLAHAQRVLKDAERAIAEVAAIRSGSAGRLRVGATQVATASLVPATVLWLREHEPGIELSLVEDTVARLWVEFERNEVDLLVTRLDVLALGSGLPHRRLFADSYRVVCGPHHPLVGSTQLGWRDVSRFQWLMPPTGTPLHEALSTSFASAGIALPPVLLTSVSPAVNVALLRDTEALALQPTAMAQRLQAKGELISLPLTLAHNTGDVGLVWREPEPGPVLAAVLHAFVQTSAAQHG